MRWRIALGILFGGVLLPALAGANGRVPAPVANALEPPPGARLLVGTTFGLLLSDDDGASWRWICEPSLYVGQSLGTFDARYVVTASGSFLAALSSGLSISRDGGCTWSLAGAPLAGAWIDDIAVSPADPRTLYVGTSTTGLPNGVFVSHDDGATWAAAAPLDATSYFRRIVAVGQDAYVSGYDALGSSGHRHLWKYRGQTGTLVEVAATGLDATLPLIEYLAASQRTPGLLYLKGQVSGLESLFRSSDGGSSWTPILTDLAVRAAVVDADDTLWVATGRGIRVSTDGQLLSKRR